MAKVRVPNTNLDQNLNGTNFTNTSSETIFQFGSFAVTSNFAGRVPIDYTNTLSSFVRPVTLETLGVNTTQSAILHEYQINAVLNLDKSNLNTYVKFGSTYEFFRISLQEIILAYPGSLFSNSNTIPGGNISFSAFTYNPLTDISTFIIPSGVIDNPFGLIFNMGNTAIPEGQAIKNVNLSYSEYVVWSKEDPDNGYFVIGFTGDTQGIPFVRVKTQGNPFHFSSGATLTGKGYFDFHIKPNNMVFEEFRLLLSDYEQYIVSTRQGTDGFAFKLNNPSLLDDGGVIYTNITMLWPTTDGYNIDTNSTAYQRFLNAMLTIGSKYDAVKTDLIARFLTPQSIKTYDLTEQGKMTKLLRVYGWEFDQLKKFIDSLVNINRVSYNKLNNIPDQLVSNLARTFGWNYFNLVNEAELVSSFLTIDETERNLNTDLMPAEINIELWRRILINANYFWKSKGTRQAIKAIFLLIGIPEPFINITEYVYTVQGKINPNTVPLTQADFPNNSLPYDSQGYPVAPVESPSFYFQISGDTDSGQAYMNNFRNAGFDLMRTVDNKKSWIQTGATTRIHYSTPQYYQEDSKLVINTKEVDVALDTARGIEYDVYTYIQKDFAINSTGFTLPFSYVNISLDYTGTQNTFTLPTPYNKTQGTLEVRYNGILLNGAELYSGGSNTYTDLSQADYVVSGNTFTILNGNVATNSGNRRDVIQATFIYSGSTHPVTGITVEYIVTRINANLFGTIIPLPSFPRGDVQVTINGIALTKGTPQFTADYIVNPSNTISGSSSIIIQNPEIISYLAVNPNIQVTYVSVSGSSDVNVRSEVVRVDSFNTGKVYFNVLANKYVYRLDYKAHQTSDVKMLINGIALEPYRDYNLNALNPYEIFLPTGINFGTVISVYYLVAQSSFFKPIIDNVFGLGDISKLSFLEFMELIQRRLINVRNRKTISDFKGGWYPTLLDVYIQYLERGLLPITNPLHSNGYTFENLYPFLSKYNAFFQKFVDELLSATIILRQGGIMIRNTIFTKQKFMYKRGVNLYSTGSTLVDKRHNPMVQYLGDDGSQFLIAQPVTPPQPVIPVLFVTTVTGTPGIGSINNFGGMNVSCTTGLNQITSYGVQYRILPTDPWQAVTHAGAPPVNNYLMSVSGLSPNTQYMYQAFVYSGSQFALGNVVFVTTLAVPVVPGLHTKLGTAGATTINTGGIAVTGGSLAQWYGMQYRPIGTVNLDIVVSPDVLTMPALGGTCDVSITGQSSNTYTVACSVPWITVSPSPTGSPALSGSISHITASNNGGIPARTGLVCYTPVTGTTKCVTVNQNANIVPFKSVSMLCCTGGISENLCCQSCGVMGISPAMSVSESFSARFFWQMQKPSTPFAPLKVCVELTRNGIVVGTCSASAKGAINCSGSFGPFTVFASDVFEAMAYAEAQTINCSASSATVAISSITNIAGNFCPAAPTSVYAQTCSTCVLPPV